VGDLISRQWHCNCITNSRAIHQFHCDGGIGEEKPPHTKMRASFVRMVTLTTNGLQGQWWREMEWDEMEWNGRGWGNGTDWWLLL